MIDEYIDDGWSGTNFERPSFQRMIEDIEAGKINCVVTKDLSRLGRNYIMTGQYTELYFPSHNVRYIAIDDGVDSEKGESEIAPFKNIINEWVARDTDVYKRQELDIMNQYVTRTIIKELRERNKMTQLQLADKLGVTDKTISKWETGVSPTKGY